MKDNILLFIKGFIVGCGKIIPGVSGGMLAIIFGIYDKGINAIANFFKDVKNNTKFLFIVGLGFVLSIIMTSNLLSYLLNNYYVSIMFLFIGLISGGLIDTIKKGNIKKHYLAFSIPIMILFILHFYEDTLSQLPINFFTLILIGGIDAFTMIVPGISGTAIFMLLGCYDDVLLLFGTFNIERLIPFFIGVCLFSIILIKIVDYMLKNKNTLSYTIILGFTIGSCLLLIFQTLDSVIFFYQYFISLLMFFIGFIVSILLEKFI